MGTLSKALFMLYLSVYLSVYVSTNILANQDYHN